MNPRPKIFRTGVYIHILSFKFRRSSLPQARCLVSYPEKFRRFRNRIEESVIPLVDVLSGFAGGIRENGSCLSSYGVVIIVCDYV